MSPTDSDSLVNLYRSQAKSYDFSAKLFPLVGLRHNAYRKQAVQALRLQPAAFDQAVVASYRSHTDAEAAVRCLAEGSLCSVG